MILCLKYSQLYKILLTVLQQQYWNIDDNLNSQQAAHTLPSQVNYALV